MYASKTLFKLKEFKNALVLTKKVLKTEFFENDGIAEIMFVCFFFFARGQMQNGHDRRPFFKFLWYSVDGKHFLLSQSETSLIKFFRRSRCARDTGLW